MAIKKSQHMLEHIWNVEDSDDSDVDSNSDDEMSVTDTEDNQDNTKFKIEKILKTKGLADKKTCLVQWLNWPSRFNSWIKSSDVEKYS